ncbi:MAG: hypothetical protein LBD97_08685 [Bifidobacteriaceae bacterium]|jgi:hypothetical protein|nr:hypothetical protein [Bifidobacteriaceae bacterium]
MTGPAYPQGGQPWPAREPAPPGYYLASDGQYYPLPTGAQQHPTPAAGPAAGYGGAGAYPQQGQYQAPQFPPQTPGQFGQPQGQFGQPQGQPQGQFQAPQGQFGQPQGQFQAPQGQFPAGQFRPPPKRSKKGLVLGISAGVVVVVAAVVVLVFMRGGGTDLAAYCRLADDAEQTSNLNSAEALAQLKKMRNVAPSEIKGTINEMIAYSEAVLKAAPDGDVGSLSGEEVAALLSQADDIMTATAEFSAHLNETCVDGEPRE